MPPALTLLLLTVSAALEVSGDALVRHGLHASALSYRAVFLLAGAGVLFGYGVVVNLPPWDFGKLLGVYVALFFVVAQVVNRLAFGMSPTAPTLFGGALIVAGGLIVALG